MIETEEAHLKAFPTVDELDARIYAMQRARELEMEKAPARETGEMDFHSFFGATYSAYLCYPRSVLQSMPDSWQEKVTALLAELERKCEIAGIELPDVRVHAVANGKFYADPLRDYDRGRRNVFWEADQTKSTKKGDAP